MASVVRVCAVNNFMGYKLTRSDEHLFVLSRSASTINLDLVYMDNQDVAYAILELAIVSQGDTIKQILHNALALAKEAEAYNDKRIWFAEHHNSDHIGSSATTILIGYEAENTNSLLSPPCTINKIG